MGRAITTFKFSDHDLDCIDAVGRAVGQETRAGAVRAAVALAAKHLRIQLPRQPGRAEKKSEKISKKP